MKRIPPYARRGASTGDVLIFLATVSIALALLYPAWSVRGFRATVDNAVADVESLAAAARGLRDDTNQWPTATPPGEAPPELASLGRTSGPFDRTEYSLGWTTWTVVDSVQAPPAADIPSADDAPQEDAPPLMVPVVRSVGAVAIHSGEEDLLAELLQRYPDGASFVVDTTWLLVLPERGEAPDGP